MNKLYVSINKLPPLFIVLFCVVSLFIFAFLIVCSAEASGADKNVSGLEFMSQSPFCTISRDYSERLISEEKQMACNRYFDEKFFAPWSQDKPVGGVDLLLWGFRAFSRRKVFGENRQPRSKEWFGVQHDNASIESFGTLNRKAISVEETVLRVFPTQDPLFYSFDEPGEGYPFDYLQNSTVQPREPLFVSHISKDGMWAFVNASTASGWMDIRRLAWISEAQIEEWKKHSLCVVVKDNVPLLDSEGVFYALSKVGTILPISRDRTLADILSEGEQKAIALAEFLTELQLDNTKAPIVFDDPVNSLDHKIIDEVVKRLIELSKQRQVIVFTHSILMLHSFIQQSELEHHRQAGVSFLFHRVKENFGITGILDEVEEVNSYSYYIKKLNLVLQTKPDGQDEAKLAAEGYGHLRSAIEITVEDDLFRKTIKRYKKGVAFPSLLRVDGSKIDAYKGKLNDIYEKCCVSIAGHSSPEEIHTTPTIEELKTDFEEFKKIRSQFT